MTDLVEAAMACGGVAAQPRMRKALLSWLPDDPSSGWTSADPREGPSAAYTWWTRPRDPQALTDEMCDALIAVCEGRVLAAEALAVVTRGRAAVDLSLPWRCDTWALPGSELPAEVWDHVSAVADIANLCWWRFDIDTWTVHIKRYQAGQHHPVHQDVHPGQQGRKLAVMAQLSESDDYEGGGLAVVSASGKRTLVPRDRGTVVALPGWTGHEVQMVTEGERWSLVLWGYGPPMR